MVRCMISRLLFSLSSLSSVVSVRYVHITMVKENLGVFEPRGGVGDQLEKQTCNPLEQRAVCSEG